QLRPYPLARRHPDLLRRQGRGTLEDRPARRRQGRPHHACRSDRDAGHGRADRELGLPVLADRQVHKRGHGVKDHPMRFIGLAAAALLLSAQSSWATSETLATPAEAKAIARGDGWTLADAKGMALYVFDGDEGAPGKSTCNGPCAKQWPPLVAGKDAKA